MESLFCEAAAQLLHLAEVLDLRAVEPRVQQVGRRVRRQPVRAATPFVREKLVIPHFVELKVEREFKRLT